jgi:hypothetical protein
LTAKQEIDARVLEGDSLIRRKIAQQQKAVGGEGPDISIHINKIYLWFHVGVVLYLLQVKGKVVPVLN